MQVRIVTETTAQRTSSLVFRNGGSLDSMRARRHKVVEVACHRPERTPMAIVIRGLAHTIINTWVDQNWSGWEGGRGGRGAVVTVLLHVLIISVPTHCACSCRGVMQVMGMLMAHAFIATKQPLAIWIPYNIKSLTPPFFFSPFKHMYGSIVLCCARVLVQDSIFLNMTDSITSFCEYERLTRASVLRVRTSMYTHIHACARTCMCVHVCIYILMLYHWF